MRDIVEVHNPCNLNTFSDETGLTIIMSSIILPDDIDVKRVHFITRADESVCTWRCAIYRLNEEYKSISPVHTGEPFNHTWTRVAQSPFIFTNIQTSANERAFFTFDPSARLRAGTKYGLAVACSDASNGQWAGPTYQWMGARIVRPSMASITDSFPAKLEDSGDSDIIHGPIAHVLFSRKGLFHRAGI